MFLLKNQATASQWQQSTCYTGVAIKKEIVQIIDPPAISVEAHMLCKHLSKYTLCLIKFKLRD